MVRAEASHRMNLSLMQHQQALAAVAGAAAGLSGRFVAHAADLSQPASFDAIAKGQFNVEFKDKTGPEASPEVAEPVH